MKRKYESWVISVVLCPTQTFTLFESAILFLHIPRLTLLFLFFIVALWPIAAVEIYTSGVLEAVNGTDVRLKCTFSSFAPVGDALTVTWNFRPQDGGSEQFVSRLLSFF